MPGHCLSCPRECTGLYCPECNARAEALQNRPSSGGARGRTSRRGAGSDVLQMPALPVPAGGLRLVLWGPPRTKKNHRRRLMVKGQVKYVPPQAWCDWRDRVRDLGMIPAEGLPLPDQPYNCAALFFRDRDVGDLSGFQEGLADVLEEVGVLSNDKWIQGWDGSRLYVDRACPRVELIVSPVRAAPSTMEP